MARAQVPDTKPTPSDEASAHVLDAAERLFLERGFAGVRVRDLADAIGIQAASLYYHAPGGKKELWDRVVQRALARHRRELASALDATRGDLEAQLRAAAAWLLSQPPVNVVAVATAQIGTAPEDEAHAVSEQVYESLMRPISTAFADAQAQGAIREGPAPDLLAGVFVAAINGLAPAGRAGSLPAPPQALAEEIVDVILNGLAT